MEDLNMPSTALDFGLVCLTPRERQIFDYLARTPGRWRQRAQVLLSLYGYRGQSESHALSAHLSRMRTKLLNSVWRIETVPGAVRLTANEDRAHE